MKNRWIRISGYGLFWSWNIILALLTAFLLLPEMVVPIITGMVAGSVFVEQGLLSLLLFVVPLSTIIIALTKRFPSDPKLLLALFYGIELPLFFLIIARLTMFGELHAGTLHILMLSIIAVFAYAYCLLPDSDTRSLRLKAFFRQIGITCSVVVALYIGLFLLIFIFPIGKEFLVGLFRFEWLMISLKNPLSILGGIFLAYTFTLLLGLPFMLIALYSLMFNKQNQINKTVLGQNIHYLAIFLCLIVNAAIFYAANQQPQNDVFQQLEKVATSTEQKQALLQNQEQIRDGLVNAYLSSYRYLSTTSTSGLVEEMYSEAFALHPEGIPRFLQQSFNFLATPFLYQGNQWSKDAKKAEQLYLSFFDTPIEKGEANAINTALKSNWRRDGMKAGLINKDRQKVLITDQTVSIQEGKHSATITLSERYENQTFEQQEIYYYFQLPEEATITGIWLSDEQDKPQKYAYQVAPRGAAQKLYVQERERRVDPALLEQVGPQQYRLRIFPIPAKTRKSKRFQVNAKPMFMQMSYQIPLYQQLNQQYWRLPKLLEKRNVFWNKRTELTINQQVQTGLRDNKEMWLPEHWPAKSATPVNDQNSQISSYLQLAEQQWLKVSFSPRANIPESSEQLLSWAKQASPQKLAVLIDISYSIHAVKDELYQNLTQLDLLDQNSSQGSDSNSGFEIDFYQISEQIQPIDSISQWMQQKPLLYGHNTTLKQFGQWQEFYKEANRSKYNALILLTDQGNYESKEKQSIALNQQLPLWILHLGKIPAYAYADPLLDYIYQSGGGVSHQIGDVLTRLDWKQKQLQEETARISEHYIWQYQMVDQLIDPPSQSIIPEAILAHQWISADFNRRSAKNPNSLGHLDRMHQLAIKQSLVSPFSSMIVLVEQRQKDELEKMSKQADRFNRDIDSGEKNLISAYDPLKVNAVPEPEEWALIIVVILMLAASQVKKRINRTNAFL